MPQPWCDSILRVIMTHQLLCPRPIRVACFALAFLAASQANAQTPTNTWVATASGNWSTGANWIPATPPVSNATTTVLQFNAAGTTSYTATNDIADPFALLGLIFNSSSANPITLAGGALTLSASGTAGFINQNGPGAVTINNNLTLTNASSATDLAIGGTGSGTVTLNGVISGPGGLQLINVGGATLVLSNPNNSFTATGLGSPTAFLSPFSTVMVTATSGGGAATTSPLGNTNVVLQSGTLAIAPAATGGAVTVGLASGRNLTFLAGGTLALARGGNTSLTFTVNQVTPTLSGNSSGSIVIAPSGGIAALGVTESLVATGAANAYTTPINGVVPPTFVGQASPGDTTGDYLTYGAAGFTGFSRTQNYTTYGTPGGSFGTSTAGTEISNVTAPTTASASASVQALRVTGTTLTINAGSTVTVAGAAFNAGRPNMAGLLLNNGTVAGGGTLDFGGGEMDLYASAGTSTISATVTSTNTSSVGPAIIKFGPGNIVLANSGNSFAAGAVYTLYGGSLSIIGPGGTNQSTALGTGAHTFVMRGGAFGVTGGDYAPTAGNTTSLSPTFLLAAGGGGFFVDGTSTLTLAQSGQLSAVAQAGPLYKDGAGTLVLGFGYNLSGMTGVIVNQGQLQVNATLTGTISPTAALNVPVPVVVNSTGTLAGTGAVPGTVTVKSGGTISPGAANAIGTFTVGGASFQPGGIYRFEYNPGAATPAAGTDNDVIASPANSTLDLSALSATNPFTVNLVPTVTATPQTSPVTYTAGSFTSITLPAGVTGPDVTPLFRFAGFFNGTPMAMASNGVLSFTFTPAPEPGFILLTCAAAAGLAGWRRRRAARPAA
jgi:hypothetical protein